MPSGSFTSLIPTHFVPVRQNPQVCLLVSTHPLMIPSSTMLMIVILHLLHLPVDRVVLAVDDYFRRYLLDLFLGRIADVISRVAEEVNCFLDGVDQVVVEPPPDSVLEGCGGRGFSSHTNGIRHLSVVIVMPISFHRISSS